MLRDGQLPSDNQTDEEAYAKGAKNTFGRMFADVILGGNLDFLGFHAGVLPVLGGGFANIPGFLAGHHTQGLGFFNGGGAQLLGLFGSGVTEMLCGFHRTVFYPARLFGGRGDEFAGRFSGCDARFKPRSDSR